MTLEERIVQLEAELREEREERRRMQRALEDAMAAVRAAVCDDASVPRRRRITAKPGVLAWAQLHPGVPPPEGVDIDPPLVRLLTPEEREAKRRERQREEAKWAAQRAEERRLAARRWIYFMQAETGGPIKIGISRDVERRRTQLQREARSPLRVLATFEGTIKDEASMHVRFAAHRLHGEWFAPAPELLSHISALNGVKS